MNVASHEIGFEMSSNKAFRMKSIKCQFLSLLFSLLAALPTTEAQQFNFEVEKRVVDNLNFYLGDPISANELLATYYNNGGFPHRLQAPDRDDYAKLAYSLPEHLIYYGLENGTNVG